MKQLKKRPFQVGLLCALIIAATVFSMFITGCGRKQKELIPQAGMKIISTVPSISHSLLSLGLNKEICGVSSFPPASLADRPVIASYAGLQIEKIIFTRPDLVFAREGFTPDKDIAALTRNKVNVCVLKREQTFADILSNFQYLGEKTGHQQQAIAIIRHVEKSVLQLSNARSAAAPLRIAWISAFDPLYTINRSVFIQEFIRLNNCINVFADAASPYPRISYELLLSKNPDIIILPVEEKYRSELGKIFYRKLKGTKAVKTNAVYFLHPDFVNQPSPDYFLKGLTEVNRVINLVGKT